MKLRLRVFQKPGKPCKSKLIKGRQNNYLIKKILLIDLWAISL
jgi:hypothetical protein|tara:strand:+ start:5312 stop:5440 length:129 start_codon:yes stop_codon:yes gene_type:complete